MQRFPQNLDVPAPDRGIRRVRRRNALWAATALLAIAGIAIALWPSPARYRATAVVDVGDANGQGFPVGTLEFNASDVARPESIQRLGDAVKGSDLLRVQVTATSTTRETASSRVRTAAEQVRATAAIAAPTRPGPLAVAQTNLDAAAAALATARTRLKTANEALDAWTAANGSDPTAELAAAEEAQRVAIQRGDPTLIASTGKQVFNLRTKNSRFLELRGTRDAAVKSHKDAIATRGRAKLDLNVVPSRASGSVKVSEIREETLNQGRPAGRLSIAAIMLVFAIAAADALFLTRVKFALPDPDVARAQLPPPVPQPAPRPVQPVPAPVPAVAREPALARARRNPRMRRARVAASPLDLPNIEVHLLDREGGLRAVQLRDTTRNGEGNAPQQE